MICYFLTFSYLFTLAVACISDTFHKAAWTDLSLKAIDFHLFTTGESVSFQRLKYWKKTKMISLYGNGNTNECVSMRKPFGFVPRFFGNVHPAYMASIVSTNKLQKD